MMDRTIYLDNQATTPTDPRVLREMIAFLQVDAVGNPHSEHFAGRRAAAAVEVARAWVAALIGAQPYEIVFTSGATEANNIVIKGIASSPDRRGDHFVTCATEHKCVLDTVRSLKKKGFEVDVLPVDGNGILDLTLLKSTLTDRTALVSLMAANNEIGVLHPIAEIAAICRSRGIPFHTDAAQAAGKVPFDVVADGPNFVSLSGHKLYAPIGIGALFISEDAPLKPEPLFEGGGQEYGIRPGTVAPHLAVAMGTAAGIALATLEMERDRNSMLRQRFVEIVRRRIPLLMINAEAAPRLPGNLSITIPGIDADHLVGSLQPRVALSTNAACSSGVLQPSHVLQAIGLEGDLAESTIRVGFGRFNTLQEVEEAADLLCESAEKIGGKLGANAA